MPNNIELLPGAISEIVASVSTTGCITLADRYGLMAAILCEGLDEEEESSVNRLLHALCRGRVKVVDDISSIV